MMTTTFVLAIVILPATETMQQDGTQAPDADRTAVRVMSFNIRYGTAADGPNHWDRRKHHLAKTIMAFGPDLLGTQETLALQRDFLVRELAGYEVHAAGRDDGRDRGEMAAMFFRGDRFEKIAAGHFWLSQTPAVPGSRSWDSRLTRVASWLKLKDRRQPDGSPIFWLNTHFDHEGQNARLESARLLRRKVAELGAGCLVIITGDFNTAEGSDPYRELVRRHAAGGETLLDTYREKHPKQFENVGTFSGFSVTGTTGARIDWILCSDDWRVVDAGIDRSAIAGSDRTPSDHFPVTAVLSRRMADHPKTKSVRILCYNIHHGRGTDDRVDLSRIAAVIKLANPDLVALQEVDDKTRRTGGVDQTAELAKLTNLYGRFAKAIDFEGGGYGQAILSRQPIEKLEIVWLPGEPDRERRIAGEAVVVHADLTLSFVTTHLHHQNAKFREQQAAKLNEVFGRRNAPVILAGDLNALPDSKPLEILGREWVNATSDRSLLTFPAREPAKQIDFVLFRPKDRFRVVSAFVIDEPAASDHRPVLVELEIVPQP